MTPIATKAIAVTKSDTDYLTDKEYVVSTESALQFTTVNISTETLTLVAHGYNEGDIVKVTSAGTTDLSLILRYFVKYVDADNIQLSLTLGGSAVNIGGANTTAPALAITDRYKTVRIEGCISVVGAGDVVVLPSGHFDTNSATVAIKGAQKYTLAAGQFLPVKVKKVFSTGTTATGITASY